MIDLGQYADLRQLPTLREHRESLKNWHEGHYYPYDSEKGFPQIIDDISSSRPAGDDVTTSKYDIFVPNRVFSSKNFIKPLHGAEEQYHKYMEVSTMENAEIYLKKYNKTIEKQKLNNELMITTTTATNPERMKRRVAEKNHDIFYDATQAKIQMMMKDVKTKRNGLKATGGGDDDDESSSGSSDHDDNHVGIGVGGNNQVSGSSSAEDGNKKSKRSSIDKINSKGDHPSQLPKKTNQFSSSSLLDFLPSFMSSTSTPINDDDDHNHNKSITSNIKSSSRAHKYLVTDTQTKHNPKSIVPVLSSPAKQDIDDQLNSHQLVDPDSQPATISVKPNQNKSSQLKKQQNQPPIFSRIYNRISDFINNVQSDGLSTTLRRVIKSKHKHHNKKKDDDNNKTMLSYSEKKRKDMLQKLDEITTKIHSEEYHNHTTNLVKFEMPYEEFLHINKKKKRKFIQEIKQIEFILLNRLNGGDEHQLILLKKRLRLHNIMMEERRIREEKADMKISVIQEYIDESKVTIQDSKPDIIERILIWYRRVKAERQADIDAKKIKIKDQLQVHLLPEIDDNNTAMVDNIDEERKKKKADDAFYANLFSWFCCSKVIDEDDIRYQLSDLFLAIMAGNYLDVLEIISNQYSKLTPDIADRDGMTATYLTLQMILNNEVLDALTIENGWIMETVKLLISLMGLTKPKFKPRLDLVLCVLVRYGGDLNIFKMGEGGDALAIIHLAAQIGNIKMIEWLLARGVSINFSTAIKHKTLLMIAVEFDQVDTVMFLLRNGAILTLEAADIDGGTALHYAARFASSLIVQLLLLCGSKVAIRDVRGRLPTEEARAYNRTEIAAQIMTYKNKEAAKEHVSRLESVDDYLNNQMKSNTIDQAKKVKLRRYHSTKKDTSTGTKKQTTRRKSTAAALETDMMVAVDGGDDDDGVEPRIEDDIEHQLGSSVISHQNSEERDVEGEVDSMSKSSKSYKSDHHEFRRRVSVLIASKDPWMIKSGKTQLPPIIDK